jgi:hypothetical protein
MKNRTTVERKSDREIVATRTFNADDEILRTDHGNRNAADLDRDGPPQEFFLESWSGQDDIQRHARPPMNEWQNARARHKIGITDEKIEAMLPHRLDKCADGRWLDGRGDVHVGAEARTSPNDRGLRAEHVPRQAPFRHHGGQSAEKLSDRAPV